MIHSFKATNFYSINKEVDVSFVIEGKTTSKITHYHKTESGSRLSPVEVIIGPNASGKTTVLRALAFIKWLLTESYNHDDHYMHGHRKMPYKPFALNEKNKPSALEIVFEIQDKMYQYSCSFNRNKILSENLYIKDYSKKRTVNKLLFSRICGPGKQKYVVEDHFKLDLPKKYIESHELSNTSIIAFAKRFGHKHSHQIVDYWRNIETNVRISRRQMIMPHYHQAHEALFYYQKNKNARIKAEDVLKQYDLGIERLGNDGDIIHNFDGRSFKLDLFDESSGTQQLLFISKMLDSVMEKGSLAIIDEFDAYLHPTMLEVLVERFLNQKTNLKQAQLILSTHNPEILNKLDKQQIVLTKKNKKGESILQRLDTLELVRSDDNFHNKYLAGKYGFLPNIKNISKHE